MEKSIHGRGRLSQDMAAVLLPLAVVLLTLAGAGPNAWAAGGSKTFTYNAPAGSSVTVTSPFGGVSVQPANSAHQVVITATTHSDKVEVDSGQMGGRIEAQTHFLQKADENEGRVDYVVSLPPDINLVVRAASGPIQIKGISGEVTLEGDAAQVDVRNLSQGHLHVQTLNGPVTLANVHGYVQVVSTAGKVQLSDVTGPKVSVNTTAGDISYEGDFGGSGQYSLSSHTGAIDVLLPATASVDLDARTVRGSVENDFPLQQKTHPTYAYVTGRSFAGTSNSGSSSVQLRSFSGKIRVKKR
jgi:DUF4097 and DUF4098 domain-containing protein YvlB